LFNTIGFNYFVLQGGMEAGKLTKLGKEQAYMLGKRLRQKYGIDTEFIPAEFGPEDI
jgi:lysophosphatidic acid phosphatase type 6